MINLPIMAMMVRPPRPSQIVWKGEAPLTNFTLNPKERQSIEEESEKRSHICWMIRNYPW